jgi:aerobic carbon-monoxide dehydrogenase medium subunit
MHVPSIEVHKAATLEEAGALLGRFAPDVRLLAGGTDVLVDLKSARYTVSHLIALGAIKGLRGVTRRSDGLRIGALTTLTELDRSPLIAGAYAALRDAVSQMATPQVRNAATVGGNVAGAVPCADLPPILIAMNATALLWSARGERSVALEDLIVGPRRTILRDDELLAAVDVPAPPARFGAAYARFGLREANAIAVAGVAAAVELNGDETVRGARIALCAVAPVPRLARSAALALEGRVLDEAACVQAAAAAGAEAEPISDLRGSADYRRKLVNTLARRALLAARQRIGR